MAYAGLPPASFTNNLTNVQLVDDISGSFDGTTQTFALTTSSSPFHAVSSRSLIVILGGVVQKPGVDYTVDGSNITFTTAPVSGLSFAARNIYGLNYLNNVNDGLITPAKLSTGGPYWDTNGDALIDGNLTLNAGTGTDAVISLRMGSGSGGTNFAGLSLQNLGGSQLFRVGFDNESAAERFRINSDIGGEVFTIERFGNIGIGTNNPSVKLQVALSNASTYSVSTSATPNLVLENTNANTGSYSSLQFKSRNGNGANSIWGVGVVSSSTNYQGDLFFQSRTGDSTYAEHVRITSTGHVGIGTNNPSSKFHCTQTTSGIDTFYAENTSSNNVIRLTSASSFNNYLDLYSSTNAGSLIIRSGNSEKIRLTTDGYLKLSGRNVQGTADGDKLLRIYQPSRTDSEEDVILFQNYNTLTSNSLKIGGGDSSFNCVTDIIFRTGGINTTGGDDRLLIKSDGNIGIGTTDPLYKLQVDGTNRLNGVSVYETSISTGVPSWSYTLSITGLSTGVNKIYVGLNVAGSASSCALEYLVTGNMTATNAQKIISTISSAVSGGCTVGTATKISGGMSVSISLSAGLNSSLYVMVIGSGSNSVNVAIA